MKARIHYTSSKKVIEKNFKTIEDLIKFKEEIEFDLIIGSKMNWYGKKDYDMYLEVYDDYRE